MQVKKDKNNTKAFETWKKQAKLKINDMKTEDEVYNWIINNK